MWWMLVGILLGADASEVKVPTAEQLRFFETSIRPVLVENCHKCHGSKKESAGLRLDSRKGMLTGGDSGPAIVTGSAAESRLMLAVKKTDPDLKMPPEGQLTEKQIADLQKWIDEGAYYPADQKPGQDRSRNPNYWSFQPPRSPTLPAVNNQAWVKSPIDQFVLAKLEAAGLEPSRPADRGTLIRRVTFDLTGLPPTPEEVVAFVADESSDAYFKVINRLLSSTAYGERWGRHWLDVARYADSNGLDENICHGNAWRYRDYVVNAFNSDKPFDRFVLEQLAGDLLPAADDAERHALLIATGFLSIGPKVLAEPDEVKMQMDIIDEQVDTVGRAFLGMTFGCARCHDHKFDPIDTVDYYGLAGIFKSTRTMEHFKKIAKWHEHVLPSDASRAEQKAYEDKLAALKTTIESQTAELAKKTADVSGNATSAEKTASTTPAPETVAAEAALKKMREELALLQKTPPDLPSAMGVTEDQVADVPVHIRGSHLKLGDVVARHAPVVMRGPQTPEFSANHSGRLALARWMIDPQHPLTGRVIVNRIWRWHFGKGLVHSTDNFGTLSDLPSHPELLDWLACRFVAEGWSIKSLHQLILTSNTYQQSSLASSTLLDKDPDNRLSGRADVRRLEAEEVRDALLAVSGTLDRTLGGSLLAVKNRAFFFDHTSKDLTDYHSPRRALYLPVVRNNVYDLFQLLDYPDAAISSGDRATTTVAPQALLMMNSELVMQAAANLASRLATECESEEQRLQRLTWYVYGRPSSAEEQKAHAAFLDRVTASEETVSDAAEKRRTAWTVLCHTLLSSNEFVYLK